jgi:hypothetical protein
MHKSPSCVVWLLSISALTHCRAIKAAAFGASLYLSAVFKTAGSMSLMCPVSRCHVCPLILVAAFLKMEDAGEIPCSAAHR